MQKSRRAFELVSKGTENKACEALRGVIHGFLGNKRSDKYTYLMAVLYKNTTNSEAMEISRPLE